MQIYGNRINNQEVMPSEDNWLETQRVEATPHPVDLDSDYEIVETILDTNSSDSALTDPWTVPNPYE